MRDKTPMLSLNPKFVRQYLRTQRTTLAPDETSVAARRARFERQARLLWTPRGTQIQPVAIDSIKGEWVIPPNAAPRGAILYLHGGAYILGSARTHRGLVARDRTGGRLRALSLDYRLAPEDPFPAGRDDVLAALAYLERQGFPTAELVLAGDSAGGGLVLSTLLTLRERGLPQPAGAALLSPWADLAGEVASRQTRAAADPYLKPGDSPAARAYAAAAPLNDPLISPVHADLTGLPPLLIQVGTDEILLDDSVILAARAQRAGVPVQLQIYKHVWHVWHFFAPVLAQARAAIAAVGAFAQAHAAPVDQPR